MEGHVRNVVSHAGDVVQEAVHLATVAVHSATADNENDNDHHRHASTTDEIMTTTTAASQPTTSSTNDSTIAAQWYHYAETFWDWTRRIKLSQHYETLKTQIPVHYQSFVEYTVPQQWETFLQHRQRMSQHFHTMIVQTAAAVSPERWKEHLHRYDGITTWRLPPSTQEWVANWDLSRISHEIIDKVPLWTQGLVMGIVFVLMLQWTGRTLRRFRRRIRGESDDDDNNHISITTTTNNNNNNGTDARRHQSTSMSSSARSLLRRSSFSFRPKHRGILLHHSGGQLNFEASGRLHAEAGVMVGNTTATTTTTTTSTSNVGIFGIGGGGGYNRDRAPPATSDVGGGVSMEILGGRRGRFGTFDFFGMNQAHQTSRSSGRYRGDPIPTSSMNSDKSARYRANSSGDGIVLRGRANSKTYHRERLGSMDLFYGPGGNRGGAVRGARADHLAEITTTATTRRRKNSFHLYHHDDTARSPSEGGFNVSGEPALNSPSLYGDSNGDISVATAEQYLYDEFGIVTLSHRVEYFGPEKPSIDFETMTPPTSWEVASRRIIPTSIMAKLHRQLKINCSTGQLDVNEPTSDGMYDFSLPMGDVSLNVHQPLEGGVVSLYVKGAPKEEWMEHTFESAHAVAQFQLDLLAYQMVGTTLKHIFESLNLLHLGSSAYEGQEFVLHDEIRDKGIEESRPQWSKVSANCIAWDDAMRAMSSIPTVRIALERLWLTHRHPRSITPFLGKKKRKAKSPVIAAAAVAALDPSEEENESADFGIITEAYAGKRLLLGPVDFFRLFIPALPETALPEGQSNRSRMEQLLSWRKRVARAAVLVRSYTRARRMTNLGWKLQTSHSTEHQFALNHRLAYDGNEDNNVRDTATKNEIYEASVSRDVLCYVRPFNYLSGDDSEKALVLSPFQGYSYVDSKYFKTTPAMIEEGGPMHISRDPIDMFPSLCDMISGNPDLDFFIVSVTHPRLNVLLVHVFVRSLANGIDPQFDNVVERFIQSDEVARERKTLLLFQLGNRMGLSFFGWLLFRVLSFLFQFTATGRESPLSLESTRDRYAFPAFKLGRMFHSRHFGGSLQTDPNKPSNYIGVSSNVGITATTNIISSKLLNRFQRDISESIVDFTYVIEGEYEDELPERALCTVRQVRIDPRDVAMDPLPYVAPLPVLGASTGGYETDSSETSHALAAGDDRFNTAFTSFRDTIQSMAAIVSSPLTGSRAAAPLPSIGEDNTGDSSTLPNHLRLNGDQYNPVEKAVDKVIEVLEPIKVPTRLKPNLLDAESSDMIAQQTEETGTLVLSMVPVLRLVDRFDIERFVRESNFEIRDAAVKLVDTAAWRGRTFPIDKRRCRVELQNGVYFHQGVDRENNPVFYIRNLALGPWRGDEDALVLAMLYRFDKCLREHSKLEPFTKVTIILLMGLPKKKKAAKSDEADGDSSTELTKGGDDKESGSIDVDTPSQYGGESSVTSSVTGNDTSCESIGNPRVSPQEKWKLHSSRSVITRIIEIARTHYVGRLSRVLIVHGRGKNWYYQTKLEGRIKLKKLLGEMPIPDKMIFADKTSELTKYVAPEELSVLVGGYNPIPASAYEF